MKSNIDPEMPVFCASLYESMQESLDSIRESHLSQIQISQQSVTVLITIIGELHQLVAVYTFPLPEEEIHFFKAVKPLFYSQLVYHETLLRIELRRPAGSKKMQERYIDAEFRKLENFYTEHSGFVEYYRSGATYRDQEYFLRNRLTQATLFDLSYYNADSRWCTSRDYILSCLLANEEVGHYLRRQLQTEPEPDSDYISKGSSAMVWTAPKAALVEILYALQSTGVFNNGAADIKQLAMWFERNFRISLGNYYHVFQEIRLRKKNRTSFLDQMKDKLIKRMDDADERNL